jgi:hypothetical protein
MSNPATELYEITPDDATDLGTHVTAISVAVSGVVKVTTVADLTGSVFVAAGVPFPLRVKRVWAVGTDATGIVGLV